VKSYNNSLIGQGLNPSGIGSGSQNAANKNNISLSIAARQKDEHIKNKEL
jgi:hypothetical protein